MSIIEAGLEPKFDLGRHKAWLEERTEVAGKNQKSRFVTISREYGCDGYPTAIKLAQLLSERDKSDWQVFSHPIMEEMISDEKLGAEMIQKVIESRYRFVNWFIDGMVPNYLQSPQSQAFERMRTLMLNLAEKGNCIIVGGGGAIITHDLDPAKFSGNHFRIVSSHFFRIKSIVKRFKVDRGEAEVYLEKKQNARNRFIEDLTDKSALDPELYNLIFNNDLNPPETIAKTIVSYMEIRGEFG